ncbi:MAG: hypothetical protein HEP71_25295 [Roseivirga sp.]|nr:hypothetical protein [Roseivirga sp.]
MPDFGDYVETEATTIPIQLPYFHTCESYDLRGILRANQLSTSHCKVYDEPLLYFFYGKPAYRTQVSTMVNNDPSSQPVCLMIKPNAIPVPKRISPFDTGAYHYDHYNEHVNKKMGKDDFLLNNHSQSPLKFVNVFFDSNERYFHSEPKKIDEMNIPYLQFEVSAYHRLITAVSKNKNSTADDRGCAVEVQCDAVLNLNIGDIELLVLPSDWLRNEDSAALLDQWDDVIDPYYSYGGWRTLAYHGIITDKIRNHMVNRKYLKP